MALACDLPEDQVYHLLYELKSRGVLAEAEVRPQDPLLLVMAESSLIRRLLLVALERQRYRVVLASDLEGARRILEQNRVGGGVARGGQPRGEGARAAGPASGPLSSPLGHRRASP